MIMDFLITCILWIEIMFSRIKKKFKSKPKQYNCNDTLQASFNRFNDACIELVRVVKANLLPPNDGITNRVVWFQKRYINRDDKERYMLRFTIFECRYFSIKFHKFFASDDQCLHDHPWSFISLILWRGYVEVTPAPQYKDPKYRDYEDTLKAGMRVAHFAKRYYAGQILYRPAKTIHRVELLTDAAGKEKAAYTFVISFKRFRKWGFFTKSGWLHWKQYNQKEHC